MDPWWNPAVEDQASDRAHRIGQERPVTVYRIVAKDTVEEKIVDLHGIKRELAESLLEGAEGAARISLEEMAALIRTTGREKSKKRRPVSGAPFIVYSPRPGQEIILPGFRISLGSKASFTLRISSIWALSMTRHMYFCRFRPMPCSPLSVPPMEAVKS